MWRIAILVVYGNLFEYVFHRWVLHQWRTAEHQVHHRDPRRNIVFAMSHGGLAAAAIVVNALIWRPWFWPALTTFSLYYIAFEAIHWAIHKNWLGVLGRHHWRHHGRPDGNFNIWLPVFDFMFGTRL